MVKDKLMEICEAWVGQAVTTIAARDVHTAVLAVLEKAAPDYNLAHLGQDLLGCGGIGSVVSANLIHHIQTGSMKDAVPGVFKDLAAAEALQAHRRIKPRALLHELPAVSPQAKVGKLPAAAPKPAVAAGSRKRKRPCNLPGVQAIQVTMPVPHTTMTVHIPFSVNPDMEFKVNAGWEAAVEAQVLAKNQSA